MLPHALPAGVQVNVRQHVRSRTGVFPADLATEYSVGRSTVHHIVHGPKTST